MTKSLPLRTVPALTGNDAAIVARLRGQGWETLVGLERAYMDLADRLALSERAKKAREDVGLEQQEIGDMLTPPVSDRTIRNYEAGHFRLRYLRQWAEITRTSYDWLLRGVDEPAASAAASDGDSAIAELARELAAQKAELALMADDVRSAVAKMDEVLRLLGGEGARRGELPTRIVYAPGEP